MLFSIVMPCYLGAYKGAANHRPDKLRRAIASVFTQNYTPWHLSIIADGCQATKEIVQSLNLGKQLKGTPNKVTLAIIDKQPLFSGTPRNIGIQQAQVAKADWICYLDADDALGPGHLASLAQAVTPDVDWLFFDDFVLRGDVFQERPCSLQRFKCGTSNIAHRASMAARWDHINQYGHDDWTFINRLMNESQRMARSKGEYLVCHIPHRKEI